MLRIIILLSIILSAITSFANSCFIAQENETVLQREGNCEQRYAPMSTFKIPLSLMGFDAGILIDETHPAWPFKNGYDDWRDIWKQEHNPKSWIKESCVWYSKVLTTKLGMAKFQDYVTKFDYGNKDLSGDIGQNNGLTNAWLSTSLQISSIEQVVFLQKMLAGKLPIKPHALAMTKKIIFIEELIGGWKLYGKTGMGSLLNDDGTKNPDLYHGWFIGFIEKDNRKIIFANHIEDDKKEEIGASQRAKLDAKEKITKIIDRIAGKK